MNTEYDGIIIGCGHNGMICCGYLAKAGLKMLMVERQLEMGGGLDSHEGARPGFWHNIHSNLHRGVSDTMWYKDLELAEHGQEYIHLRIAVAMLTKDHKAILWYGNDAEKTAASIGRFSAKDGKTFLALHKKYNAMNREIFMREFYAPPVPFEQKKKILERSALGRLYLEWQPYSINDFFAAHFENDTVRGMFSYLSVIRGFEVDSKGLGMIAAAAIGSGVTPQMSKGSTHKLAHTLHRMVVKNGADIIEADEVQRIIIENGRAVGVRCADGREFRAKKFVISSVNPNQTFLDMVGREHLTTEFANKVEKFKYSDTTPLFTLHLALNERLYWKAADYEPDVNDAFYLVAGLDGLKDIEQLYREANAKRIPTGLQLIGGMPSQFDPQQAPPGKAAAYFWQVAPGNLCKEEGGRERWDQIRKEYTERCVKHLMHYATNLTRDNIVAQFGMTPIDVERHLPNMVGGDIQVGELSENQILDKRPFPECSQYRTPVPGLYMCGASTHPSGSVTGGPGYNAASVICRDAGLTPWWNPIDPVQHWEKLAAQEVHKPE